MSGRMEDAPKLFNFVAISKGMDVSFMFPVAVTAKVNLGRSWRYEEGFWLEGIL